MRQAKHLPDVSVEHRKKRAVSVTGASSRMQPITLGPLRGCPNTEKHFASNCAACKSLYGRYLRERQINIEARIIDKSIPLIASPFSR